MICTIYWNDRELTTNDIEDLKEARPTELYWAEEDGTEQLPDDADFEVEFIAEYDSIWEALEAVEFRGRGFLSGPDDGRYTHRIISLQGSIAVEMI